MHPPSSVEHRKLTGIVRRSGPQQLRHQGRFATEVVPWDHDGPSAPTYNAPMHKDSPSGRGCHVEPKIGFKNFEYLVEIHGARPSYHSRVQQVVASNVRSHSATNPKGVHGFHDRGPGGLPPGWKVLGKPFQNLRLADSDSDTHAVRDKACTGRPPEAVYLRHSRGGLLEPGHQAWQGRHLGSLSDPMRVEASSLHLVLPLAVVHFQTGLLRTKLQTPRQSSSFGS